MDKRKTWIGLAHVKPRAGNDMLEGAIGAFVSVVGLAHDEEDFASMAASKLASCEFDVPAVEDIELLEKRTKHHAVDKDILRIAENLSADKPIDLCTFDSYEKE